MLIVFQTSPRTTPSESPREEKAIAKIIGIYLAWYILASASVVSIGFAFGRKDTTATDIEARIIERIHIHSHATTVFGQTIATGYVPIAETRCIVVRHRTLVVGLIIVNQAHTGYGIFRLVQLAEDI